MRTYSSKSIGNCLRTLAYTVTGALCALLTIGALASTGWDLSAAGALTKGGVALGAFMTAALLLNAGERVSRWVRYLIIMRLRQGRRDTQV